MSEEKELTEGQKRAREKKRAWWAVPENKEYMRQKAKDQVHSPLSEEQKQLLSKLAKERWQDPEYREKHLSALSSGTIWSKDAINKRSSARRGKKYTRRGNAELIKAAASARMKILVKDEKYIQKLREASKLNWENPEYVSLVKERLNSPEVQAKMYTEERNAKISIGKREYWAQFTDEERKQKCEKFNLLGTAARIEGNKLWRETLSEEEKAARDKHWYKNGNAASVARWEDPEFRAKHSKNRREWQKRYWSSLSPQEKSERMRLSIVQRPTSIEIIVGSLLDELGIEYKFEEPIGQYLVDFYLPEHNLVVECDGDYWHNRPGARENDAIWDKYLRSGGFKVLRLWEHEINSDVKTAFLTGLARAA